MVLKKQPRQPQQTVEIIYLNDGEQTVDEIGQTLKQRKLQQQQRQQQEEEAQNSPETVDYKEKLDQLAAKTNRRRSDVVNALFLSTGDWSVARQILESPDNEQSYRPYIFNSRDDAIIFRFLQTVDRIHLQQQSFLQGGKAAAVSEFRPEFQRHLSQEEFVALDEYEKQYSSIEEMMKVRGDQLVQNRIEFLRSIDAEIDLRLSLIAGSQQVQQ